MSLKPLERDGIDAAIAAGNAPRAPKGARGLILSIPGARHRTLVDVKGGTTPLLLAIKDKNQEAAKLLVENGANLDMRAGNKTLKSVLHDPFGLVAVLWGWWRWMLLAIMLGLTKDFHHSVKSFFTFLTFSEQLLDFLDFL